MNVSCQLQAPVALPLSKQPPVSTVTKGGWTSKLVWTLWRRETCLVPLGTRSQDSAVGIATGYGLDGRAVGVRVPVGGRFFSSSRHPDQFWGLYSAYPWVPGALSSGVKQLGCEADNSPQTSAKVENM
jgi:hypothetical protein